MIVEMHEGRRGAGLRLAEVAYDVREHFRAFLRGHAYNPMQPRDEIGRWTLADGQFPVPGLVPPVSGEADGVQIAQGTGLPGYGVDLAQEEGGPHGGHTIERHVGKSEAYLRKRLSDANAADYIRGWGERRAGSFSTIESANKLVNATIADNFERIDNYIRMPSPEWMTPPLYITSRFNSVTGVEAVALASGRSRQIITRPTNSVAVWIYRNPKSPRGFSIRSAYPMQED